MQEHFAILFARRVAGEPGWKTVVTPIRPGRSPPGRPPKEVGGQRVPQEITPAALGCYKRVSTPDRRELPRRRANDPGNAAPTPYSKRRKICAHVLSVEAQLANQVWLSEIDRTSSWLLCSLIHVSHCTLTQYQWFWTTSVEEVDHATDRP